MVSPRCSSFPPPERANTNNPLPDVIRVSRKWRLVVVGAPDGDMTNQAAVWKTQNKAEYTDRCVLSRDKWVSVFSFLRVVVVVSCCEWALCCLSDSGANYQANSSVQLCFCVFSVLTSPRAQCTHMYDQREAELVVLICLHSLSSVCESVSCDSAQAQPLIITPLFIL